MFTSSRYEDAARVGFEKETSGQFDTVIRGKSGGENLRLVQKVN